MRDDEEELRRGYDGTGIGDEEEEEGEGEEEYDEEGYYEGFDDEDSELWEDPAGFARFEKTVIDVADEEEDDDDEVIVVDGGGGGKGKKSGGAGGGEEGGGAVNTTKAKGPPRNGSSPPKGSIYVSTRRPAVREGCTSPLSCFSPCLPPSLSSRALSFLVLTILGLCVQTLISTNHEHQRKVPQQRKMILFPRLRKCLLRLNEVVGGEVGGVGEVGLGGEGGGRNEGFVCWCLGCFCNPFVAALPARSASRVVRELSDLRAWLRRTYGTITQPTENPLFSLRKTPAPGASDVNP